MDQIWLAAPSPALRLWLGAGGATWRLNPAAMALGRGRRMTSTSWRELATAIGQAVSAGPERDGRLDVPPLRWRSLPMNTGWLVWLLPDAEPVDAALQSSAAEFLALIRSQGRLGLFERDDADGRFRWDRHLFDLLGFDFAGVPPSPERVIERIHPDDRDRVLAAHRHFVQTPGRHSIGYRLHFDDGSERFMESWLEVHADDADRPTSMLGLVLDQTDSVLGERERIAERERAERLARRIDIVADAAGVGVWLIDVDTGRTEWNKQMFVLHGLPDDASPPHADAYVDKFVHHDDRAAVRRVRQQGVDTHVPRLDTEFRIVRPDGSVRWIEYRSRRDEQDGRGVIVGIALDATDRIAQRIAVERAQREQGALRRAGVARSEFLARMSHELRTPLNAVLGFAQLIEHDGASVPISVQLDRVAHIREAGEQLLRMIGDVLDHLRDDPPAEDGAETVPAALTDEFADSATDDRALSVLYIEDNPVNVILVEELVAMRPNTSLRCAVTGLAGVALAAAGAPDVVLVDMQLPDIDGFEVLRRLRANSALDRSSIIALSANGIGEDIALALAAGFDDYWTKPIDFRHFLTGLDTLARAR